MTAVRPGVALTGRRGMVIDGTAILTAYAVLLVVIPSRLVVGPLGAAGTPANIAAIGCLMWWLWEGLSRAQPNLGVLQPVRLCAGMFAAAVVMSYVMAMRRPISDAEASIADIGLLSLAGWMGALLLAHDGLDDLHRLQSLIRRLVTLGGLLAALGLVQFISGRALVDMVQIPGLTSNTAPLGVAERNGFNRPSGTAIHAIEFSVVITMLIPLAIVTARVADGRHVIQRWWPVVAMVGAVPIAISRSALVGAAVGLAVLLPVLPAVTRRLVIGGAVVATVLTFALVPGLVGSMIRLFTGISGDGSAQSRTNSYAIVWEYFVRSPLFGRGFSTFLPSHRILDNQYLLLLLDVGLVGLLAMLALLVAGVVMGLKIRCVSGDRGVRELGQALVASLLVGGVGFALFDGLSFSMAAGMFFLLLGVVGAFSKISANTSGPDGLLP